jgi:uncharacterized protein (UPF0128 family)
MRLALVHDVGVIIIFFQHAEVAKAITYVELALKEEKAESEVPPEPKQHLFKNLNTAERYPHILFSHKDFSLGIRFLELIATATAIEGGQTKDMEQFLSHLNEYSKTLVLQ